MKVFCMKQCMLPIMFEYGFEFINVVVLVGHHQVGHGEDLGIVLVRLRFLGIEWVYAGFHQPVQSSIFTFMSRLHLLPLPTKTIGFFIIGPR